MHIRAFSLSQSYHIFHDCHLIIEPGDWFSALIPVGGADASYSVGLLDWWCTFRYEMLNLCITEWGKCDLRMRIFSEGRGIKKSLIWGCKLAVSGASLNLWSLIVRCIFLWFIVKQAEKAAQNTGFKNGDAAFASSFLCFGIFSADWKNPHLIMGILHNFSARNKAAFDLVIAEDE